MKRVSCVGMVGKFPTPKGSLMFWDTGKTIKPAQLVEIETLQHIVFRTRGKLQEEAKAKMFPLMADLARQVNVYPIGFAAFADDGRILVSEPYYNEQMER